ncbi:hypothetical protein [Clostridium felsineum]|uniref:hypothetical protein n=1 Tax=Clostridium felsineum TaxID=36839 RepID=UPI00098CA749|nr:hypothetical protein [Clostridium felsineum]URZ16355.1 hypothetical protein CLFE_024020 [Clostridium felsineum DSM 794]
MFSKKKLVLYFVLIILCIGIATYFYKKSSRKVPIPSYTLDKIIKHNVEPTSIKTYFGGKPFCDYKVIDFDQQGKKIKVYIWLVAEEYYLKDNKVTEGTGGVFPAFVTIEKRGNKYNFINCKISREEETDEALEIFPKNIRSKASRLSQIDDTSVKKAAEHYFAERKK